MHIQKFVILMILTVAGNVACRIGLSCDNPDYHKSEGTYHIFERGIDDVGIIVEDVIPVSIGSVTSPRHQTNHGRIHTTTGRTYNQCFCNIHSKILRSSITSAARPRTLYYIFALHRMRD